MTSIMRINGLTFGDNTFECRTLCIEFYLMRIYARI